MSIWVRSQSRETLVNINCFYIGKKNRIYTNDNLGSGDYGFCLGEYGSEAEALAVLDMIQKAIQKIAKHPDHAPVFQMPEAGFLGGAADDRP
jgi:hypothetical protein